MLSASGRLISSFVFNSMTNNVSVKSIFSFHFFLEINQQKYIRRTTKHLFPIYWPFLISTQFVEAVPTKILLYGPSNSNLWYLALYVYIVTKLTCKNKNTRTNSE